MAAANLTNAVAIFANLTFAIAHARPPTVASRTFGDGYWCFDFHRVSPGSINPPPRDKRQRQVPLPPFSIAVHRHNKPRTDSDYRKHESGYQAQNKRHANGLSKRLARRMWQTDARARPAPSRQGVVGSVAVMAAVSAATVAASASMSA